jgi:Flp pilus assembly protein TadD
MLGASDRNVVRDAISLLKRGDHLLALSRLTAIKDQNPDNSSLRILASYALLQAGNLLGAFEEAEAAHNASNGNSYKCWFLAKVSLLAGNKESCRRELDHVKKAGDMVAEVRELEKELKKN